MVTAVVYHRPDGEIDTLAKTDIPVTVQIPKWLDANAPVMGMSRVMPAPDPVEPVERIEVVQIAKEAISFEANSYIKDGNSVLMFEDSRVNDFDYNDLVLYVRHEIRGNNTTTPATLTLYVKPVALGGVNEIAFGWEDGNGEHLLTNNVRQDYFFGREGILNTWPDQECIEPIAVVDNGSGNLTGSHNGYSYTMFRDRATMQRARYDVGSDLDHIWGGYFKYDPVSTTCSTSSNDAKMIKYFIKTSGFKFYVASIDKSAPAGTFPYGIAIPNAGYHGQERVPFEEVYTSFGSWIRTGSPLDWGTTVNPAKRYTKHVNYARW